MRDLLRRVALVTSLLFARSAAANGAVKMFDSVGIALLLLLLGGAPLLGITWVLSSESRKRHRLLYRILATAFGILGGLFAGCCAIIVSLDNVPGPGAPAGYVAAAVVGLGSIAALVYAKPRT